MINTGKIMLGVAAGVAIGTVIGLMLAPEKGSITLQKIAEYMKDVADNFETMKGSVTNIGDSLMDGATSAVKKPVYI